MKKQNTSKTLIASLGLEHVPTPQELRAKGYKVDIVHLRKAKGMKRQLCLAEHQHFVDRDSVDPKGGRTELVLTLPSGDTVEVFQNCADGDNFCRKVGAAFAIKKALGM